ncbi:hypothetical protein D3C71_1289250 [compost metagenome]
MVLTTADTTAPPRCAISEALAARWLAWRALSAFCFTVDASSSIDAAVSSNEAACSSVRLDRSALPAAIWPEALEIVSEPCRMTRTAPASFSCMSCKACSKRPVSSLEPASIRWPRSPLATVSAALTARASGRVMDRVTLQANSAPSATAMPDSARFNRSASRMTSWLATPASLISTDCSLESSMMRSCRLSSMGSVSSSRR